MQNANLVYALEFLRVSKHQERQVVVRRKVLYVLLGPFMNSFASCYIHHTDWAYIDTMGKIVDCGPFVQFQIFVEKARSPSGIPLFLVDCRAAQAVRCREQLVLLLAGPVASGGHASCLPPLSEVLLYRATVLSLQFSSYEWAGSCNASWVSISIRRMPSPHLCPNFCLM